NLNLNLMLTRSRRPDEVVIWCPNHASPGQDTLVLGALPIPPGTNIFFASKTAIPAPIADRLHVDSGIVPVGTGYKPLEQWAESLALDAKVRDVILYSQGNVDHFGALLPVRDEFSMRTLPCAFRYAPGGVTIIPVATTHHPRLAFKACVPGHKME